MTHVSVIIPVHNAEKWLDECLESVTKQTFTGNLEVSIYNDGSKDTTSDIIKQWKDKLEDKGIVVTVGGHCDESPRGVGYAKNQAVLQSRGEYLCYLDADDVMDKDRTTKQYQAAVAHPKAIVGCQFHREPEKSTQRYTDWANHLTQEQLYTQIYTSHGPTLIMPTWFSSREMYNKVGGFDEGGKGVPEDLIYFFRHLELGGCLFKVEEDLLMYRYHPEATTFSVHEDSIWNLRMICVQNQVLAKWKSFTIWNAGKQGRKFFRSLSADNQKKVLAFCDVDQKKIQTGVYIYEESKEKPKPRIPVLHFSQASKPFIICVKMDMTGGAFEKNLASLNLKEGEDYFHFN